jgi:hypothetical protein
MINLMVLIILSCIQESPIQFLSSHSFTVEEKHALSEKYVCGLQLLLVQNRTFVLQLT